MCANARREKMEQYTVTGMSCAACSARVEKAVSKVPGVTSCSVSLLTNSMGVEGTASEAEIIKAVEQAGYGASRRRSRLEARADDGGAVQAGTSGSAEESALQAGPYPASWRIIMWQWVFCSCF